MAFYDPSIYGPASPPDASGVSYGSYGPAYYGGPVGPGGNGGAGNPFGGNSNTSASTQQLVDVYNRFLQTTIQGQIATAQVQEQLARANTVVNIQTALVKAFSNFAAAFAQAANTTVTNQNKSLQGFAQATSSLVA